MSKIKIPHIAGSFQGVPEPDPVTKLPKTQHTYRDGTTTVSASLASHVSGPNSWNRSHAESVASPAGEELTGPDAETPLQSEMQITRALSKRRVVGDRSTLYEPRGGNRNPNGSIKPAGGFKLNDD